MAGWHTVYAQLLTKVPTLPGLSAATVSDGPMLAHTSAANLATVGDNGQDQAGTYAQDTSDVDTMLDETGEIHVRFIARSGATKDLPTLRTTAAVWPDGLSTWVRADQTLGGALSEGSTVRVAQVEQRQVQSSDGALVELIVTVAYTTRL